MAAELTNHLWQSTVFAIVVGLLAIALRGNRAQVRYWLWFSASIKFLAPFAVLMSLGAFVQRAPVAKKIVPTPAVSVVMEEIAQPFPETAPVTRETRDWRPVAIFGAWTCGFAVIALIRFRGWPRIRAAVPASTLLDLFTTLA
jgi:bla regulator protein blaR1